jgi:hypothetical protein
MRRLIAFAIIVAAGLGTTLPAARSAAAAPARSGQDRLTVFETFGRAA